MNKSLICRYSRKNFGCTFPCVQDRSWLHQWCGTAWRVQCGQPPAWLGTVFAGQLWVGVAAAMRDPHDVCSAQCTHSTHHAGHNIHSDMGEYACSSVHESGFRLNLMNKYQVEIPYRGPRISIIVVLCLMKGGRNLHYSNYILHYSNSFEFTFAEQCDICTTTPDATNYQDESGKNLAY